MTINITSGQKINERKAAPQSDFSGGGVNVTSRTSTTDGQRETRCCLRIRAVGPVRTVTFWLVQLKVQSCSLGGANVLTQLTRCSLIPHESASQTASRSILLFLRSSQHRVPVLCNGPPLPPSENWPVAWGVWTYIWNMVPWAHPSLQHPERRGSAVLQGSWLWPTNRQTDRQNTLLRLQQ